MDANQNVEEGLEEVVELLDDLQLGERVIAPLLCHHNDIRNISASDSLIGRIKRRLVAVLRSMSVDDDPRHTYLVNPRGKDCHENWLLTDRPPDWAGVFEGLRDSNEAPYHATAIRYPEQLEGLKFRKKTWDLQSLVDQGHLQPSWEELDAEEQELLEQIRKATVAVVFFYTFYNGHQEFISVAIYPI